VQQPEIIFRLLLPADEDAAKAIHPAVSALNDPTPCLESRSALDRLGLFSTSANVRRVAEVPEQIANLIVVVSFVQAHVLLPIQFDFWTLYGNAEQRRFDQLEVVAIGAIDSKPDGNSAAFTQQAAFDAVLGSIRRIGPGFFPRPMGPSSSHRPSTANATGSP